MSGGYSSMPGGYGSVGQQGGSYGSVTGGSLNYGNSQGGSYGNGQGGPGSYGNSQGGPGSYGNSQGGPGSYGNSQGGPGSYGNSQGGPGGYGSSYSSQPSYSSGLWGSGGASAPILPQRPPLPGQPYPGQNMNRYGGGRGQPFPPGMEPATKLMPQNVLMTAPPSKPSGPPKRPNFKLRRSIQPRPIMSILCEMAGQDKPQFEYLDVPEVERERRAWQGDMPVEDVGIYECKCTIGKLEFIAEGHTKPEAKTAVTEISVQGMITAKCDMNNSQGVGNSQDHCPWAAIASLALHKLFTDWEAQGYTLPKEIHQLPNENSFVTKAGGVTVVLPDEDKNPLQKLNEMASRMKLTLEFELTGEVGTPNDKVFTMSVCVAGKTYSGQGKSKKAAKHSTASSAMAEADQWYQPPVQEQEELWEEEEQEEQEQEHGDGEPSMKKINLDEGPPGAEEGVEKLPGSYPGKK